MVRKSIDRFLDQRRPDLAAAEHHESPVKESR
jgi:hypothetical protein